MNHHSSTDAQERLAEVSARIEAAAREAGRAAGEVRLIAVSKTFGAARILPLLEAGHTCFGENRVQEAAGKWPELKTRHPECKLHLIGPLQSNKTKEAVALFDAIHTVDRPKIAGTIGEEMQRQGRRLELFVQVNTGGEAQKSGVAPQQTAAFVEQCRNAYGLTVAGLMCIPPLSEAPAPHFALLAKLARQAGVHALSMGMSADFDIAIAHGATHVRVGSALFGPREAMA